MAVEIIGKLKPKNNGDFRLVDAVDVEMGNGNTLEEEFANLDFGGTGAPEVYKGDVAPESATIKVWIDTTDNSVGMDLDTALIEEFKALFKTLNSRIAELEETVDNLNNRVKELESGYVPDPDPDPEIPDSDIQLTFEDDTIMTFEDDSIMSFEGEVPLSGATMTLEDDTIMTFKNNDIMIFEE